MNTDPSAIRILCYGDSNTWGKKADGTGRFAADVRWTGQLQDTLGSGYSVIEEGLNSRTTNLDYDKKPGRNGKSYLRPCLESQSPLDIVILMLGTNDLKLVYRREAEEIAHALAGLVDDIRQYGTTSSGQTPEIILVSPTHIHTKAEHFTKRYTGIYGESSKLESRKLAGEVKSIADLTHCTFVDAASVAKAGEDGIHMDAESHTKLAILLHSAITGLQK